MVLRVGEVPESRPDGAGPVQDFVLLSVSETKLTHVAHMFRLGAVDVNTPDGNLSAVRPSSCPIGEYERFRRLSLR